MTDENKVQEINKKELVDPSTNNEENTNTDGSSAEENLRTEYTVLVNGERITLYTDKWGASLQDKLEGHGIHIQRNGDIALLSGKGGKGKACGGRMLVNTAGGQLIKSGATTAEYKGSSTNAIEGEGSSNNGDDSTAYSGMYWGAKTEEVKGTYSVNAQHIELAADTITLKGESKIIIETPELIQNIDSAETKIVTKNEEVDSSNTEVKETTTSTFDSRGSTNIVTTGHLNHSILGDYALNVDGYMDLQVQGKSFPPGVRLVENRSAALTIGINGLKNGGNFYVFAKGTVDVASGLGGVAGNLNLSTLGKIQTSSTLETKIEATTKVEIEATTGDVTVKAPAGNFDVDALKIYLN